MSGSKAAAKFSEEPQVWSHHPDLNLVPDCGILKKSNVMTPQVTDYSIIATDCMENGTSERFQMSDLSIRKSSLLLSVPFRRDFRMLKKYFYKCGLAWL